MYDLKKIGQHTYYLDSPSRIGIYSPDGKNAYAIDSGNGDTSAKKLLGAVESLGLTLAAIFNTHSHADHTGGNALCQKRTGCKVFAPRTEAYFANTPTLEPVYLFGGFAPKKLFHSFFTAAPSTAQMLLTDADLPDGLEVIGLSGHSFDQVGYKTSDGVVFLGDALVSKQTIQKYGVTFCYDINAYLASIETIKNTDGTLFVPSHAEPTASIKPLADINANAVRAVQSHILNVIETPKSFDEILREVFIHYDIEMNDAQFALLGFTLRSYLVYCENAGLAEHIYTDFTMKWRAKHTD